MAASTIPEKLPARFSARFFATGADWLNPIVVKELRQAVQSRFVLTALMVLLSIQLAALAIYLLASGDVLLSFDAGRQVFLVLFAILLGVSMLFVPLYTAVRLAAERSDTNVDLLFITTITPRRIVAGKLLAAVVLTVLIFSACLPFMALTYFLRGIDLPSIFVALALGFAVVIVCTQVAIFVACLPVNRGFKALLGLMVLIVFVTYYFTVLAGANELVSRGVGSQLGSADFWQGVGWVLLAFLFWGGLFFVLAVALLMPPAANRALPVRSFITSAWLLSGAALFTASAITDHHAPVIAWQVSFCIILGIGLFVAVSEREYVGRRVLRTVPRASLKRAWAFFLFSGAANGLAWTCLMLVTTLAGAWLWARAWPAYQQHAELLGSVQWFGGMCLYFFCYALSGALLRRWLFKRTGAELTWLLGVILLALGSIVPFLIGALIFFGNEPWSEQAGAWLVGNPFAWSVAEQRKLYAAVGGVWALLVAAFSLPWFVARVRSFRPLDR